MTTNISLEYIMKCIKQQFEKPTLLEVKHYAKLLKHHGNYSKINKALNDISKKMGYRKFADFKPKLDDRGIIVDFVFKVSEKATFEMPYFLEIHCELFIDGIYDDLLSSSENPHLVIRKDGLMYIQYSNSKLFVEFVFIFKHTKVDGVFFNEHGIKEFNESEVPVAIEDLYETLNKNYINNLERIDYVKNDKDEFLINLSNNILLKPINKQNHQGLLYICDSVFPNIEIDMDVLFGRFSSKSEAEYYSENAKAYFINDGEHSKIKVISRGKEFIIDDNSIIFKKVKDAKKKLMGKPLNPIDSDSFNIIKESLNKDSIYHEQYMVELNDIEIIDYSLAELSKYLKDNFSFQIIANGTFEKKERENVKYNTFSESEIFFNKIKEVFNNEKSLQKYTFEELADDIYENKDNHSKELNLTFKASEIQEYERLINLFNKDSKHYKYNIKIIPIEEHEYVSVCFEFCEQNYGEVPPNDFIHSSFQKRYIYRSFTDKKDINNKKIRFGDKVKDSKGNTYLVDKYVDKNEFFLSCNEDLNTVYDLKDFNDSLEIVKNQRSYKLEDVANKLMFNTRHVSLNALLNEYILNIKNIKKNPKEFDLRLERLHYCIEYIVSLNFDISDWELFEIPINYTYCFFNKKDKKSFDLAVYDKDDITPRYLDDSFSECDANTIEEAIEKYTKDA